MFPFYHDDIPASSGIYRIVCQPTGKYYVGSAKNLRQRQRDHFSALRSNTHINAKLQHAWNKYGAESFIFDVIELVLPISLTAREQYWLDTLQPCDEKGFNINRAADSRLGMKHTVESNEKNRQAHLGKKSSPEARAKLSIAGRGNTYALGNKLSLETRQRMSQARMGNTINQGRKLSPEHRQKIGQAQRGRKVSPESVEKRRGKKMPAEARAKLSQAMRGNKNAQGRIVSAETRQKIGQAHVGKKQSPEAIEKHRQAMLGRTYDREVYASRMKTLIVTDPSGTEYVVHGIKQFCRDHHLNDTHLIQVAKGKERQHKGWTARYLETD